MIDFNFEIKTKLYFGKDKELLTGEILASLNVKKVLIVIGQSSVKKSGLLDRVITTIKEHDIDYRILEGVIPNPSLEKCHEGVALAKEYHPDFILAIGGGSVMDTAKSIAVGYYYDGDTFDFNLHKLEPKQALPVGAIVTIAASGSEMSTSCVIQNYETETKIGFNSELVRPVFAIENPELTYSVSPTQTAYGVVDIMMHTLERYFQPSSNNEVCDYFALGLLKSVVEAGKAVHDNPKDYEARSTLLLCSSLSHNGLTNIGKKPFMPVHQLEHVLSGFYPHVAHAAGLSVLFPAWAKYYIPYDVEKFSKLSEFLFGLHNVDKLQNAYDGIKALEEYFKYLDMPLTYKDLDIENPDLEKFANKLTNDGQRTIYHHTKPMTYEVALEIYKKCL